jgi:hypothetical protein
LTLRPRQCLRVTPGKIVDWILPDKGAEGVRYAGAFADVVDVLTSGDDVAEVFDGATEGIH